jgi:hypothetical protein
MMTNAYRLLLVLYGVFCRSTLRTIETEILNSFIASAWLTQFWRFKTWSIIRFFITFFVLLHVQVDICDFAFRICH